MLMPSPHREAHDTYIGDYLATGERRIIGIGREVQGQRKNGELFPMHLGVSEVETPDDQFFVGIVRDLSEENALRAALSENRHFLADVIENSPDATYVKDRAGRYLLVNREAARVMGQAAEHLLGQDDVAVFQFDPEGGVGEVLDDLALHFNQIFLCHPISPVNRSL